MSNDLVRAIHNRDAGRIVEMITRPTYEAGGDSSDVLVLLESVITGVFAVAVRMGGDHIVLEKLVEGVEARLAATQLLSADPRSKK